MKGKKKWLMLVVVALAAAGVQAGIVPADILADLVLSAE